MDNLALAAVTKQATLDMLAQTNTIFAKANAKQQSTITKLTTKITSLTSKLEQLSAGGSGGNAGRGRFDPNNYCWSHGYKLAHSHTSATCINQKEGHKSEATRRNPMGGSTWNAGHGNAPYGASRCGPAEENSIIEANFIYNKINTISSGYTNPINIDDTSLIDSAASITLLNKRAKSNRSKLQEIAKSLSIPNGATMKTTETLDLLLDKLPPTARTVHICPGITNNLLAVMTLCNSGCSVIFLEHGVTVEFNGEIVLRGWCDQRNDLWRVPITSKGEGQSIIPPTPSANYNPIQGIIMQSLINSIYECDNTDSRS